MSVLHWCRYLIMANSNDKKYLVVEFPEETQDNVTPSTIISSTWIVDPDDNPLMCYWPGYFKNDTEKNKALINHLPLHQGRCGESTIKILYSTGDYTKAIKKLKSLETQSSVSQTDEDDNNTPDRRNKRPPKHFSQYERTSSFESDEDALIAEAPVIRRRKINTSNVTPLVSATQSNTILTKNCISHTSINDNIFTPSSSRVGSPATSFINSASTSSYVSACTKCQQNEGLIRQIIIEVQKLRDDVKFLININNNGNHSDNQDIINVNKEINPCTTREELEDLNKELENVNYMTSLVTILQMLGGKDVVDTTYRILAKIIAHNVSLSYNWSGKNNKHNFNSLTNIVNMITVVVRKNPFAKNATRKQIEDVIKVWLRNAPDREGGRSKRKKSVGIHS